MDLLKRHRNFQSSRAVNGVIRRAADAITNLAHENGSIKSRVRWVIVLLMVVQLFILFDPYSPSLSSCL